MQKAGPAGRPGDRQQAAVRGEQPHGRRRQPPPASRAPPAPESRCRGRPAGRPPRPAGPPAGRAAGAPSARARATAPAGSSSTARERDGVRQRERAARRAPAAPPGTRRIPAPARGRGRATGRSSRRTTAAGGGPAGRRSPGARTPAARPSPARTATALPRRASSWARDALDLLRREGRRHLRVRGPGSPPGRPRRPPRPAPVADSEAASGGPRPVPRVRRQAEAEGGVVGLRLAREELREPGGAADDEDQDAGRHRVERAQVADRRASGGRGGTRATTSCDVGPFGLVDDEDAVHQPFVCAARSMASRTSGTTCCADRGQVAGDRAARRRSCGRRRRTAARRSLTSIVALRAEAHAVDARLPLLEEDDGQDLLHRERHVDEPLGVVVACRRSRAPSRGPGGWSRGGPTGRPPAWRGRRSNSLMRPTLLLSNTVRAIADRVDAGLERLPADVERPRRDAGVVERPGVGEDGHVDVHGHLRASAARPGCG